MDGTDHSISGSIKYQGSRAMKREPNSSSELIGKVNFMV